MLKAFFVVTIFAFGGALYEALGPHDWADLAKQTFFSYAVVLILWFNGCLKREGDR